MNGETTLTGRIAGGVGKAAYFTGLDWVQQQCAEKLNFKPFPGTLNIEVDEASLPALAEMKKGKSIALLSPDPKFCNARVLPVNLENVRGAILIPDEEVNIHGKNIVEIIAPLSIKQTLSLTDGDMISVRVEKQDNQ